MYDDVYKAILDELVDDAMWELCFEVHKAVKLGYFFLDPDPEKYEFYFIFITVQDILKSCLKQKYTYFFFIRKGYGGLKHPCK